MAALILVSMAGPLHAQHGSAHGGFSGGHTGFSGGGSSAHASTGFHGAFSAPVAHGFAGSRSVGRPYLPARGMQPAGLSAYGHETKNGGSWRHRRPYISPYRRPYAYGVGGWVAPYYLGDPGIGYDSGDDDVQTSQNASPEVYDTQPYSEPEPPAYPAYPQRPAAVERATSVPANEDAVTLIFKDGRPPEQIRNFLLTQGTLYVGGERRREISVDDIDLAATSSVNRNLGVEFQLPGGSR